MTPNFITQYHPLTARPFRRNKTYEEYIPCKQLRPYVACFWSSEDIEKSGADGLIRVFPDTCMDIINLDMSDLYNQTIDLDLLMPGCNVAFEELFYCRSFEERIAWMESYLLGIFSPEVLGE